MKMRHLIKNHVKEIGVYLLFAYVCLSLCCFLPFFHDYVSSFHANGKLTEQNSKIVVSINKISYRNTHEYCMICLWQITSTPNYNNPQEILCFDLRSHKSFQMADCNLMQSIYLSNRLSRDPPQIA
jgi:hypothetical protein